MGCLGLVWNIWESYLTIMGCWGSEVQILMSRPYKTIAYMDVSCFLFLIGGIVGGSLTFIDVQFPSFETPSD